MFFKKKFYLGFFFLFFCFVLFFPYSNELTQIEPIHLPDCAIPGMAQSGKYQTSNSKVTRFEPQVTHLLFSFLSKRDFVSKTKHAKQVQTT